MKNGKNTVNIAVLQEQIRNLKENDLTHLSGDIRRVEDKVDGLDNKIFGKDGLSDKLENTKDELRTFVAKVVASVAVAMTILGWIIQYLIKHQ